MLLTIGIAVVAEHIRHFRPRPSHWLGRSGGRWRFRFGVDGKSRQQIGLTPDEYRAKWSLPADYPMVAPNYAA